MRRSVAGFAWLGLAAGPLAAQGVVYGAVRDPAGAPLPDAWVAVAGTALLVQTDAGGAYRIARVPPGRVTVRAARIGYAPESRAVEVAGGDSARVDFVLTPTPLPLAPIDVTTTRTARLDEPAVTSIAVISERELAGRAVNTVAEAVDRAPGVQFLDGQINIRGSTGYVQGLGARVLLLVDGVPVNQGDRGGINWDILPVDQVQRVEIVKGASSSLYGSSALGGVVHVVTRETPPGVHGRVRATAGAYADPPHPEWTFRDRTGLHGGADVTLSYGNGPFRGRFAGGARRSDGYREQDGREHWQLAGRGEWRFSPESDLRVSGAWAVDDYAVPLSWCTRGQCDDRGQAYQPFKVDTTERGAHTVSRKGYLEATFARLASARVRWQARASWVRTRFNDYRPSAVDHSVANRLGAEARLEAHPSNTRHVTVGAEAARADVESNIFGSHTQGEYAAYGESEQPLGAARLTVGARTDFLVVDGAGATAVVSPRIGAVLPGRSGAWRASVGRGFRAPSLAERFVRTTALGFEVIPNPNLDPETFWTWELGHARALSPRARMDVALFWTDARRLIEPVIVIESGVPKIQFRNLARARLAGLDLAVTASPLTSRLVGSLAYTYLHARELARDTLPERPLAFRPRHLATASADYDLAPFGVGADFRYMSRLDRVDVYPDDPRVAAKVFDLRASYRRGPLQVHLLLANALNYIYALVPRTLAPVRTVSVTLTWIY
ncbi:MAG TPA: TonB-dependent receptor [Gemmatimonadales bacterium]|nr:TonB-dependent receptor [Gemmatimonadales bacterium]